MATYKGLAVPLYGDSTIVGNLTISGNLTTDGVITSDGFVIRDSGYIAPDWLTTAPTTGLVKGDVCWLWSQTSFPKLGICTSTATQKLKYIGVTTVTFARDSMP